MKYYSFLEKAFQHFVRKCNMPLVIIISCVFLQACREEQTFPTIKASAEFAKLKESGGSAASYHLKNGVNVVAYFFNPFSYYKVLGNENADQNAYYLPEQKPNGFFSIGGGFGYVQKGAKFEANGGTIGLNYLELPINAIYTYKIGLGSLYGGIGPYFAYGVGGKDGGESSFGENNGGFKRFDAGLNFMLGYKLQMGLSLDFGYDLGLANIEYASQDVTGHSRSFSINVGYQIAKLFIKKK